MIDGWRQDTALSQELGQWFSHDLDKRDAFGWRYVAELDDKPDAWRPLLDLAHEGTLILIYAARDRARNNALALKSCPEAQVEDWQPIVPVEASLSRHDPERSRRNARFFMAGGHWDYDVEEERER